MATEGRMLVELRGLRLGLVVRIPIAQEGYGAGKAAEVWVTGRGPRYVTLGREVLRNKRFAYYNFETPLSEFAPPQEVG